jgi:nucleotide-binding universal stress UspA family protein
LIAVDLGKHSRKVVEATSRVVDFSESEGILLHAFCSPFTGFAALDIPPKERKTYSRETRRESASGLKRFRESLRGIPTSWATIVSEGDPRSVITREARKRRPDLIVVGAQGDSPDISSVLLGSVAEYVTRTVDCDVLVVR